MRSTCARSGRTMMTNSPEAMPDSRLTTTEQEPAGAGEQVTAPDVLDRDTYDEVREPRSAGRLPLGDGTWHQLARQYVWVQLISTGVFALIVLAAVLLVTLLWGQWWAWIPGG